MWNEAFNQLVWCRLPKTIFVRPETLELGTVDAFIVFNSGDLERVSGKLCGSAGGNCALGLK